MVCAALGRDVLFLLLGEVEDAHVAELHAGAVAAEAHVAVAVEEAGMVLLVHGVGVVAAAVGSHVVALASLTYVAVEDNLAVHRHGDVVAHGAYLLGVPCAELAKLHMLGHDDAVH